MRILIDECLPRPFADELKGYDVSTVRAQRWLGLHSGALLRTAAFAGYDVLITADRGTYGQNVAAIGISVVLLSRVRNRLEELLPLIPDVLNALAIIRRGEVIEISPRRNSLRDAARPAAAEAAAVAHVQRAL